MKTDQQIQDLITRILKDKDMEISNIIKIASAHNLTINEVKHILRMLTFFGHNYMDNTTDWFPILKSNSRQMDKLYRLYTALGISFEDIAKNKGFAPDWQKTYRNVDMSWEANFIEGTSPSVRDYR